MAVKYVKDFEFPSDKGFTGSAGAQHVKAYARGGTVKKAMGGDVTATVDPAPPVKGSAASPQSQAVTSTDGRDGRRFGPAAAGGALSRADAAPSVSPRKGVAAYRGAPLVQQAAKGGPAKPVKRSMGGLMGLVPALMGKDKADGGSALGLGLLGMLAASAANKKKAAPAATTGIATAPASAAAALAANQQQPGQPGNALAKGGKVKSKC